MILPNDNAIAEKMTTLKPDGACNVVNDTMQVRQQKNNNDDEIPHGNATPHLHVGALYTTHENMNEITQKCKAYG
jgi:hypothetical protein